MPPSPNRATRRPKFFKKLRNPAMIASPRTWAASTLRRLATASYHTRRAHRRSAASGRWRSVGSHEDAERMSCQIGVHEERLDWIIGSIEKQACSQRKRPLMLHLQVI